MFKKTAETYPEADIYMNFVKTKQGVGWSYDKKQRLYTVTGDVTIYGTSIRHNRIKVMPGVTANITLYDVEIDLSKTLKGGFITWLLRRSGPKRKKKKKWDTTPDVGYCAFEMSGATVNLILRGKSELISQNDRAGIELSAENETDIGSKLTITSYSEGIEDKLFAWSAYGAGIGGKEGSDNGEITITNGLVCSGSFSAAGIGGGKKGQGGKIKIEGGLVYTLSKEGAGIGGGRDGHGGTIDVIGGEIMTKSTDGAGIGGGMNGPSGTIIITGGEKAITRSSTQMEIENESIDLRIKKMENDKTGWKDRKKNKGLEETSDTPSSKSEDEMQVNKSISAYIDCESENGAGIGGGAGGAGDTITISECKIHESTPAIFCSTKHGAGIGGGTGGFGGIISLKGGYIFSNSYSGAAIGGGSGGAGGTTTLSNGFFKCHSHKGAGIGGGFKEGSRDIKVEKCFVVTESIYGNGTGGGQDSDNEPNGQFLVDDAVIFANSVHANGTSGRVVVDKGILAGKDDIQEWEDNGTGIVELAWSGILPHGWKFTVPAEKVFEIKPNVRMNIQGNVDCKSGDILNAGQIVTQGDGRLIGKVTQKDKGIIGELEDSGPE
jgi:hypothetical protein